MKKILIFLMIISGVVFADIAPLPIEKRLTNEVVEMSKEAYQGQIKNRIEWEAERQRLAKTHPGHLKTTPFYDPSISYEEYRMEPGFSNWIRYLKLEDTIWGKLVTVPVGTRMCGNDTPRPNGGGYARTTWDLKSRLDLIKSSSAGYRLLPEEWITPLMLEYINSVCYPSALLVSPRADISQLKKEVEKIRRINEGLPVKKESSSQGFGSLIVFLVAGWLFVIFISLFSRAGSSSLWLNILLLRWWIK